MSEPSEAQQKLKLYHDHLKSIKENLELLDEQGKALTVDSDNSPNYHCHIEKFAR